MRRVMPKSAPALPVSPACGPHSYPAAGHADPDAWLSPLSQLT